MDVSRWLDDYGSDAVVPFRMELVFVEGDRGELRVGDLDAGLVCGGVKLGSNL